MPIDASIILGLKPPVINPAQHALDVQAQQMNALKLQEAQQQANDLKSLDAAFQQPGGRDAILGALPGHLQPMVAKQFADLDKSHADYIEAQGKADAAEADMLGRAAVSVKAHDYSPVAAQGMISDLKQKFANNPAKLQQYQAAEQALQANPSPDFVKSLVDPLIAASPEQQKIQNEAMTAQARATTAQTGVSRLEAELPGLAAEAQQRQQVATGTQPITPYQQQELAVRQSELALSKQREARESATANAAPVEIKTGSPEYQIAQDLASGKMTFPQFRTLAAYNRNASLKFAIYALARQLNPEFDPSQFELGFKMASNPQIRQRIVAINALGPVIDQIDTLAQQAGNTDVPGFNKLLNAAKFQLGNRTITDFRQLQVLLGDEVGNALGLGSGSDLKTKLGLDLVNPNLSPANFKSTMDQLRSVLEARRQQLQGQMGPYGAVAGPSAVAPSSPSAAPAGLSYQDYLKSRGQK